jgi:adenine-specific DNA glycosylase
MVARSAFTQPLPWVKRTPPASLTLRSATLTSTTLALAMMPFSRADLRDAERETGLALDLDSARVLAPLRHTFSHFHLDITPVLVRPSDAEAVMEGAPLLWYNIERPASVGLAAPVKRLLAACQAS